MPDGQRRLPGGPTAHVDTFARDNLPPRELWPDMDYGVLPELAAYPDRMNVAVTLVDDHVAAGHGGDRAVLFGDVIWSYADLKDKSDRVARVLAEDFGVVPGNRVLLRGFNSPMMAAAWLGIVKAGAVCVATMPLLRGREIAFMADKAQIDLALTDTRLAADVEQARTRTALLRTVATFSGDGTGDTGNGDADIDRAMAAKPAGFDAVDTAADDVALISFTSGHDGDAQGHLPLPPRHPGSVRHVLALHVRTRTGRHQHGLAATRLHVRARRQPVLPTARRRRYRVRRKSRRRRRCWRRSSGTAARRSTRRRRCIGRCSTSSATTTSPAWPSACRPASTCRARPGRPGRDTTGIAIIDGIGSTEMTHIFVSSSGAAIRPGATGRVVQGYQARVQDDAGNVVPPGEIGNLAIKGPTGCRYLADPERQATYVRDGWNLPGDVYKMDTDGYFWYQARADDMIISSGYNISGPEVGERAPGAREGWRVRGRRGARRPARDDRQGVRRAARPGRRRAGDGQGAAGLREARDRTVQISARDRVHLRVAADRHRQGTALRAARTRTGKGGRTGKGARHVKINCLGGGPGGLYFAILMKKAFPAAEIHVIERNRADDTFGFGVVFSDATLDAIAAADPKTHDRIVDSFAHWDDIDIHFQGRGRDLDRTRLFRHVAQGDARNTAAALPRARRRFTVRVRVH